VDQEEQNQRDGDVLPAETVEQGDYGVSAPALADDVLPDTLVLLPLPGRPFFPGQVQPVSFNPDNWQATLDAVAQQGSRLLGLAFVDKPDPGSVRPDEFPETGTAPISDSQMAERD